MTSSSSLKIELERSDSTSSVVFLADGRHIVGSGSIGRFQWWRAEDGREVGPSMDPRDAVFSLVASRDGKWIVSEMESGRVMGWNAVTHSKLIEFHAHPNSIKAVDVSPDMTKIATGSDDSTVCAWALNTGTTGERLLGPLKHDHALAAVNYSPDGRLLATATFETCSIRIYDSQDGRLLVDVPVIANSYDRSLAWSSNGKHLFASSEGNIKCLDVLTGTMLSEWPIHSSNDPLWGITIAGNGKFIIAAADSSISFWDTTTHEQIGSVIEHADVFFSMAISRNYHFVTSGGTSAVRWSLRDILPPSYCDDVSASIAKHHSGRWLPILYNRWVDRLTQVPCEPEISWENASPEETNKMLLTEIRNLREQQESSEERIAKLENTVRELRIKLARHQRNIAGQEKGIAGQEKGKLDVVIESLRAELRARDESQT